MDKSFVLLAKIKAENNLMAVEALTDHNKSAQGKYESVIKNLENELEEFGEPEDHREGVLVGALENALKQLKEITENLY